MGSPTDVHPDRTGGIAVPGTWVWWPRRMLELVVFGPREVRWTFDDPPPPV